MAKLIAQFILVSAAAALLVGGVRRAGGRGEPAARAWTAYALWALVIVSALNIFARNRAIAIACGVACALLVALVLLAAALGAEHGTANRVPAILRAVSFFVLIGLAFGLQAMPSSVATTTDSPLAG